MSNLVIYHFKWNIITRWMNQTRKSEQNCVQEFFDEIRNFNISQRNFIIIFCEYELKNKFRKWRIEHDLSYLYGCQKFYYQFFFPARKLSLSFRKLSRHSIWIAIKLMVNWREKEKYYWINFSISTNKQTNSIQTIQLGIFFCVLQFQI